MNQTEVHNPVLAQIHQHASVRRYKPDPVPRDWVEAIVAAGQRAATSSNLQAYSVVAVTDAAVRREAAHWCGDQAHIAEAPVFLVWCADLSRLERVCELRGMQQVTDYVENFLVAVVDTALAMQNAALAAESLGLGTCYIGGIRNHPREIIRLLGLPRLTFPIAGMTLGFPAVRPEPRPRLPLRAVLHWERYDCAHEDEALREYDRVMAATGIYDRRQIPVPGKPEQLEDYGWLEHTARRISQPTRTHLRDVLREQGFALR
ncbi:MAG: NADPH-dependent oxidoreductase [Thermoflexales bacterium]|nr:NADPH-dependent oxidoreductase [Thermoflexales bacterium]